eukprot:scaffold109593_cov76-Phaeocystis_antarctica.AAC.1
MLSGVRDLGSWQATSGVGLRWVLHPRTYRRAVSEISEVGKPKLPPLPLRYATSRGDTRSDISPAASSAPMLHASATSRSRSSKRVRWL